MGLPFFKRRREESVLIKTPPIQRYIKALQIEKLSDIDIVKEELRMGNIVILKITPIARKSFDDTRKAIHELTEFVRDIEGDIARLGEERIVATPPGIKIWRSEVK